MQNLVLLTLLVIYCFLGQTTGQGHNLITKLFLTSCRDDSAEPELPNLSFAKTGNSRSGVNASCNMPTNLVGLATLLGSPQLGPPAVIPFTWYYYQNYPQNCGETACCHDTIVSKINLATAVANVLNGQTVTVFLGWVNEGPYTGKNVTITRTEVGNLLSCSSTIGLEAQGGQLTLAIVGGPICSGVVTWESCPGLKTM